jgi:hypothetical protein
MSYQGQAALRASNTEAPHPTFAVERGTECLLGGDIFSDTTQPLRLQRLRLIGIVGHRARLLSELAWEARHG